MGSTIESERKKEERNREKAAAEACRSKISRLAVLTVHEQTLRDADDEEAYVNRQNERLQLDKEVRSEELQLPEEARARVRLGREALSDARSLVAEDYYGSVDGIGSIVESHITDVAVAVIRGTEIPPMPRGVRDIAVAMNNFEFQLQVDHAEERHEHEEAERKWLRANPEAAEAPDK